MVLGAFAGMTAGGTLTELIPHFLSVFEPFMVFGGLALGIIAGQRIAKEIHDRHLDEEQRQLDWVAKRIELLIEGERDPAMLGTGDSR